MTIHICADGFRLFLPIPVGLGLFVLRHLPSAALNGMQQHVPAPYNALVTRQALCLIVAVVQDMAADYRGLELIHVATTDGTFVSVRL